MLAGVHSRPGASRIRRDKRVTSTLASLATAESASPWQRILTGGLQSGRAVLMLTGVFSISGRTRALNGAMCMEQSDEGNVPDNRPGSLQRLR